MGRGRELVSEYRRERGILPTAALLARAAADRRGGSVEERLLRIEGERGELGPAHRGYRGNTVAENRDVWGGWDWSAGGEEWTESGEWKRALVREVMEAEIPAGGTLLEIGPGSGRWSEALLPRAEQLLLLDLNRSTLELCRRNLGDPPGVEYVLGNGSDLAAIGDGSVDAIWSFDVFVHIRPLEQAAYLAEMARVLRPGGVAVIHHAGTRDARDLHGTRGWRSPMTRALFASLARERGFEVVRQLDSWGGGRFGVRVYGDVITVLRAGV